MHDEARPAPGTPSPAGAAPDDALGITGRDFIVFGDNWGRHQNSCQHIFKRVLRHNRVLWVQTIGLRNPSWSLYDLKRSVEILRRFVSESPAEKAPIANLTVCNPRMLPYSNLAPVRAVNRASVIRTVRARCQALGFVDPIVVTSVPNAADYLGAFDESVSAYYCLDDFTEWPGAQLGQIGVWEERLLTACDVVITTSSVLQERKTRNGRVPRFLGHGVDVEHFSRPAGPEPAVMAALPRPIVGFFGAISPWVDLDLLIRVARAHPTWTIALIGPSDIDVTPLRALPNIHLLGRVPYAELPAYARAFDVGIIPFVVNELTAAVNPLKLLEYLACGAPVVSSDMREVRKFGEVVRIAHDATGFAAAIEAALAEGVSAEARARRLTFAEAHSWDSIARQFCAHLTSAMTPPARRPAVSPPFPGAASHDDA